MAHPVSQYMGIIPTRSVCKKVLREVNLKIYEQMLQADPMPTLEWWSSYFMHHIDLKVKNKTTSSEITISKLLP